MIKLKQVATGIYRYEEAGVHVVNPTVIGPVAHHWELMPPGWSVIDSEIFAEEVKRHHTGQTISGAKPRIKVKRFILITVETLAEAREWISANRLQEPTPVDL